MVGGCGCGCVATHRGVVTLDVHCPALLSIDLYGTIGVKRALRVYSVVWSCVMCLPSLTRCLCCCRQSPLMLLACGARM